jgi:hypothetical protein
MTITVKEELDFNDLRNRVWNDAEWTLDRVIEANKEDELMDYLATIFDFEEPTMTELNDFLWFEWETIFEDLDIPNPYDEDEDEDDEDEEKDDEEDDV